MGWNVLSYDLHEKYFVANNTLRKTGPTLRPDPWLYFIMTVQPLLTAVRAVERRGIGYNESLLAVSQFLHWRCLSQQLLHTMFEPNLLLTTPLVAEKKVPRTMQFQSQIIFPQIRLASPNPPKLHR